MNVGQFRIKKILLSCFNYCTKKWVGFLSIKQKEDNDFVDDFYYDVQQSDKYVVTNGDVPY